MFWRNHFEVLLVDDEPDVLAVSKLALKNIKNLGVPLKIHTAASKKEAIEFLGGMTNLAEIAVGFIDIVMETDHAGLELCDYIRRDRANRAMQLIIRTGQAGKAPEREVVEKYDISNYVTKVDATDEKLFCLVRAAVKQWAMSRTTMAGFEIVNALIPGGKSASSLLDRIDYLINNRVLRDGSGRRVEAIEAHQAWYLAGQSRRFGRLSDETQANALRDKLARMPGRRVNAQGDELVADGNHYLLRLAPKAGAANAEILAEINFPPPDYLTGTFASILSAMRNLLVITS